MHNGNDEPLDQEAIFAVASLAGQTASELKALDKLALGSSPNMKGLQYDPQDLIRKNFLPRMQRNGAPPASVMNRPAPVPQQPLPAAPPAAYPQPAYPMEPMPQPQPQPRPQFQPVAQPVQQQVLSDAQISLLVEKILRLERMLERAIENQESLQNTLDKSLDKLLKKKLKDVKITFKDDDTNDSE